MHRQIAPCAILVALAALVCFASTDAIAYSLDWQVMGGGGGSSSSVSGMQMGSTIGEPSSGTSSSPSHTMRHGFWQVFSPAISCTPGDVDGAGEIVDIDDIVYLIMNIFAGGPAPIPDTCCGDVDASGFVDIDDVVYLIMFVFGGGPAPLPAC